MNRMDDIIVKPIGIICTPYLNTSNMPIQPIAARGIKGYIEISPEYVEGLKNLEGFSHIILIYHFHKIKEYDLEVITLSDSEARGIFASKEANRPNAIGISTVKLIKIEGNILYIEQVDMLDGTPLIDIKPFYPRYDNRLKVKTGWLDKYKKIPIEKLRSDESFY